MDKQRGLTIYFTDGSKLKLDFPQQTDSDSAALMKLKEINKDRQLMIEVDGALLLIPFENIKYMQLYPAAPDRLPPNVVRGASIGG